MIRRYDAPPAHHIRYRLRPGAYALICRGNEALLTLQTEPLPELQLPGGGIDRGEHILPALHREVAEETGWHIHVTRRLGAFRRFVFMPEYDLWAEKLCHVYLARPGLRRGPPTDPHHHVIWSDLDSAAQVLGNAGDRAFVAAFVDQMRRVRQAAPR